MSEWHWLAGLVAWGLGSIAFAMFVAAAIAPMTKRGGRGGEDE